MIQFISKLFNSLIALFIVSSPVATMTPTPFIAQTATPMPSPVETTTPTPTITPNATPVVTPTIIATKVPVITNNTPPNTGFSKQNVNTEFGTFTVNIVVADISSTTVIVDSASDSDCNNNCPVFSLGEYVTRNGGWAGINGSYFCPKDYPNCSGKENTFDLLVMNKNKKYLNSDNNVYSTNPLVVFGSGYVRFISQGSGWGRDTSPNGVLMNYPLLVSGGNITFSGDGDPKKGSRGFRSFVATKGSKVYIGVTQNVTVAENAYVLKALGMENAMNLDSGGSTALWHGGYKIGPGRNIPNAIVFK
jgi:hypothetical protein